jgi:hypothetical protein
MNMEETGFEYIVCPACGLDVPDGRFCKFCGKLLHPDFEHKRESTMEDPSPKMDEKLEQTAQSEIKPKFGFSLEGMSSRDLCLLLSKVELAVLAKDLDVLIEQIRSTRHALHLKHADKSKIAARAESLRTILEKAKSRRKELLAVKGRLEIKDLLLTIFERQSQLAMLEDLAGSIEQEVYDEKQNELKESIKSLKSQLKKQTKIAKDWIKSMKKKTKSFHKEMSRLIAQHKIGDISSSGFEKSKKNISRSISILEGGCKILQDYIEQAEAIRK